MASGVKSGFGALRQDVADAGGVGAYARQAGGNALRSGWREITADTPKGFTGRQAFSHDFLVGGSKDSAVLADMRAAGGRLKAPLGDEHPIGSGTEPENEPHTGTGATNKNEPPSGTSDDLLNQTANKTGPQLSPDEVKGELSR